MLGRQEESLTLPHAYSCAWHLSGQSPGRLVKHRSSLQKASVRRPRHVAKTVRSEVCFHTGCVQGPGTLAEPIGTPRRLPHIASGTPESFCRARRCPKRVRNGLKNMVQRLCGRQRTRNKEQPNSEFPRDVAASCVLMSGRCWMCVLLSPPRGPFFACPTFFPAPALPPSPSPPPCRREDCHCPALP